jgi:uncharacterized membrane protein YkoI
MNGKTIHQRTALMIAAGVTAFTLVGIGALASRMSNSAPEAGATAPATPNTAMSGGITNAATSSPAAESAPANDAASSLAADREAQYRELIQQANQRIQEANQRLIEMEQRLASAPAGAAATDASASSAGATSATAQQPLAGAAANSSVPNVAVSLQRALEIALAAAPGTVAQRVPELVNFQGSVAYEVALNAGLVYVDANSGAVLYNGALAPVVAQPVYHDDDERDEHDDDRHEKKHNDDRHEKKGRKGREHDDD